MGGGGQVDSRKIGVGLGELVNGTEGTLRNVGVKLQARA